MNVQGKIQACEVDQQDEIQNDVKQPLLETVEDANANQIINITFILMTETMTAHCHLWCYTPKPRRGSCLGNTCRNEDPELEEFELLECQDLETSVVEEEEQVDMQSERSRKGAKNFSDKELSSTAISTTLDHLGKTTMKTIVWMEMQMRTLSLLTSGPPARALVRTGP